MNVETAKQIALAVAAISAGWLLSQGTKAKPEPEPVVVTPSAAESTPAAEAVKCFCTGDCKCNPCLCKEPDECQPPNAVAPAAQSCQQCGGDGLLDGPYGPMLCPTCGKGKSAQIPTFQPELYTQPQPAPKPAVQSSCANGSCSSGGSYRRFRLFGRRR